MERVINLQKIEQEDANTLTAKTVLQLGIWFDDYLCSYLH